jgi:hypothetical protein
VTKPKPKRNRIRICNICGCRFRVTPSTSPAQSAIDYCQQCYRPSLADRFVGEGALPGETVEDYLERRDREWMNFDD